MPPPTYPAAHLLINSHAPRCRRSHEPIQVSTPLLLNEVEGGQYSTVWGIFGWGVDQDRLVPCLKLSASRSDLLQENEGLRDGLGWPYQATDVGVSGLHQLWDHFLEVFSHGRQDQSIQDHEEEVPLSDAFLQEEEDVLTILAA